MLTLYHHSTSVCSAKVRLALYEKKIPWTPKFVDILAGEQFDPGYMKLNPRALVPTLVDGGAVIFESTVINEYLDDRFPERSLRPKDPLSQSRMRIWTKLTDEKLHDACTVITYVAQHRHRLMQLGESGLERILANTADPVFRERKRRWVIDGVDAPDVVPALRVHVQCLEEMEQALSSAPWLAGPEYSLADIALTPYINRLAMLNFDALWRERPQVAAWFERIRGRPNFPLAVIGHIPAPLAAEMGERGRAMWPVFHKLLHAINTR